MDTAGRIAPDAATARPQRPTSPGAVTAWIAAAAWAVLILSASGPTVAESRTTPWLAALVRLVWGELGPDSLLMMSAMVRKGGHFVEYAILSLLFFRAARLTWRERRVATWAAIAFSLAMICAVADETLQSFVPTRTGTARDVALDGCGASAAAVLAAAYRRRAAAPAGSHRGPEANAL